MGEELYELPKGWVWASTEGICEIITNGNTPKQADMNIGWGEIPYIKIHNLTKTGTLDFSINPTFIPQTVHENILAKSKIFPGDVLMNVVGPPLGKVSLVPNQYPEWNTNQNVCIFRLVSSFNRKYFTYCLLSDEILNYVIKKSTATAGQSFISLTNCRSLQIPIPPLAEQHRIVAKIEEIFTELDAGVELLKKLKVKLKRYRQAVLKAAVEGNLTKGWREANQGKLEPASMLRDRILKQRREKWEAEQLAKMKAQGKTPKDDSWKLKYKEPLAPDTSDLPELPDGWCWASLDTVLSGIKTGKSFKCENENPPSPEEVGVIKVSAVSWGEFNELESKTCTIQSRINPELFVREGDFLFSRANTIELIGACVIAKKVNLRVMLSDKILRFYFVKLSSKWILFTLRSRQGRNDIERFSTGNQESMRNIGQDRIRCIRIPIAPLQEMEQIINEFELRLSVIDQLEKTIDYNLKRAEKLRQSILKQGFEGKLVPQDPNDEPAEQLLERIKAEKAKHETKKKPKRQSKTTSSPPRKSETTAIQLELNFNE